MSRLLRGVTPELGWIVLALSLGLTVLTCCLIQIYAQHDAGDTVRMQVVQSAAAIKTRLDVSAQLLRNSAAMLQLNSTVQNTTWQQYQQNLAHLGWPAEVSQLGYAQRIAASEKNALTTAMRADAMPGYQIHPLQNQSAHAPILFSAPATDVIATARPGFDLLSLPATRYALEMATDSGSIAFHTANASEQTGSTKDRANTAYALLVLPVFPGNAVPATIALRRQHVIGFVFAFIKIDQVLRMIDTSQFHPIRLIELSDQNASVATGPLNIRDVQTSDIPLALFGSRWQASVALPHTSSLQTFSGNAGVVALCGLIISALLFVVIRLLAASQLAHRSQSRRSTQEIRQLKNQLSALMTCSDRAIIRIDRRQRITAFNPAAETIFGVRSDVAIGVALSRFLPHRLNRAKRIDSASSQVGRTKHSAYRLQSKPDEPACRYHGEPFPFEATIFKSDQWGQPGTLILLKDLTGDSGAPVAKAGITAGSAEPSTLDDPPPARPHDAHTTLAIHFQVSVGKSVCDAEFYWLAGCAPFAARLHACDESHQTLQDSQSLPQTEAISVNQFINTRIHSDDRAAVKQQWKDAFRTGKEIDCIYRLLLADEETKVVRHWMTPAGSQENRHQFAGLLHELHQDAKREPPLTSDMQSQLIPNHALLDCVHQLPQLEAILPVNGEAFNRNAVLSTAPRNDRRRRDPVAIEAGKLYRQLQFRIMHLDSAREAQQKRLARDMHDDFGQLLTAMKMDLIVLQTQLAKVDHRLSQQLGDVGDLVDAMVVSVRRIIANLPPQQVGQHGLVRSLELLANGHAKRHQISCELHIKPQLPPIDEVMTTPIYRIVQEALNNVAKHARATEIEICIEHIENRLHVRVTDNGSGIAPSKLSGDGGFGLIGMRERVNNLRGEMRIDTANGIGTTIHLMIPVEAELTT